MRTSGGQLLLEILTRPVQTHLRRASPDAQRFGDLVMRVALDHFEQEDRAQRGRKRGERLLERDSVDWGRSAPAGKGKRCLLEGDLRAASPGSTLHEGRSYGDLPEPAREASTAAERLNARGKPEEHFLNDVAGLSWAARDAECRLVDHRSISIVRLFEGTRRAGAQPRDQVRLVERLL